MTEIVENEWTDRSSIEILSSWDELGDRDRGGTVVKVLCYKSEGRWFHPRLCNWNFSLT